MNANNVSWAFLQRIGMAFMTIGLAGLLAACGGGNDSPPAVGSQVVTITAQPTDQSAVAGTTATFSVAATNATAYQWQRSSDGGATFADVAGAKATNYTTAAATLADSGAQYRVIVCSNGANCVTSRSATLTVNAASVAPIFTTQPASVTITAGQSTQFTAAASGTPTPNLQWQLSTDNGSNWSNISGATGAVFDVLNAAQGNNGRQFRAVASNSQGSVNSNAAVLTVNLAPASASIVFTRGSGIQSSPSDVMLIKEDGSGEINLAATADDEQFLGVAPSGRIVYLRRTGAQVDMYSVNADGTGTVLLASSVSATDFPRFNGITPNGWVIYFRTITAGNNDIFSVKADGTAMATLASTAGSEGVFTITSASKIIYGDALPNGQSDIYSINADGTGRIALATAPNLRKQWAGVSSAGQIVFSSCLLTFFICTHSSISENGGTATLLATDAFEGQYKVDGVTQAGRFIFSGSSVRNFDPGYQRDIYIDRVSTPLANSPDTEIYKGSTADGRVIYSRLVPLPNTNFRSDLYIVNANGTNTTLLAADAAFAAVAPNGRIIYTTFANGLYRVHAVNTDGTGVVTLGNSSNTFQDFFQGMTANGRVVYSQENGTASGLSLFAVNTDGTSGTLLAVRSFFVANTPSGKVLLRNQDNGNANLSIVNSDGIGLIPLAFTPNNEFYGGTVP